MSRLVACFAFALVAACGEKTPDKSTGEPSPTPSEPSQPSQVTQVKTPTADADGTRIEHERELGLICASAGAAAKSDDRLLAFMSRLEDALRTPAVKNILEAVGEIDKKHAHTLLRQGALELGIRNWTCEAIADVFGPQEETAMFVNKNALRDICKAAETARKSSGTPTAKRAAFVDAVSKQNLVPFFREAMTAVAKAPNGKKERTLAASAAEFGVEGWKCEALASLYAGSAAPPASGPVVWDGVCEAYAKQCNAKSGRTRAALAKERRKCDAACTADGFKKKQEMCAFIYCGVETKRCDNEGSDEPILQCMKARGWL